MPLFITIKIHYAPPFRFLSAILYERFAAEKNLITKLSERFNNKSRAQRLRNFSFKLGFFAEHIGADRRHQNRSLDDVLHIILDV